jgi:hypothetical protein
MLRRVIVITVILLFAGLVVQRVVRYATFSPRDVTMPAAVVDVEERQLFERPAGKYTAADILANGKLLPSEKYRGFRAVHDYAPQPGDRLCPVTRTKSNPDCTWIVDGQTYQFCCPPCIPEFVRKAKQNSTDIRPADTFMATGK